MMTSLHMSSDKCFLLARAAELVTASMPANQTHFQNQHAPLHVKQHKMAKTGQTKLTRAWVRVAIFID